MTVQLLLRFKQVLLLLIAGDVVGRIGLLVRRRLVMVAMRTVRGDAF